MAQKVDYKSAGVDVTRGYDAVRKMKEHIARTTTTQVLTDVGGFGGMYEIPTGYTAPVLVSGTDGVGTKLELAFMADRHDTIGIDCVAMCVNDIICSGAKPMYFLDYIGTGLLEPDKAAQIVAGIAEGCVQSGCALVGGETAEMPGFYAAGTYDLAGFSVGIVEKSEIISGVSMQAGNVILGLASSGIHSNGYSLVRKLCFEVGGYTLQDTPEGLSQTLEQILLEPTKIYVQSIMTLLEQIKVHGIAHITGGGWVENIPRMLPEHLKAVVETNHTVPEIFPFLQDLGNLSVRDMYETFNMGIGMMVVVSKEDAKAATRLLEKMGETVTILGTIETRIEGDDAVVIR